ncbi:MAG: polyprenyl synthetase family protein [Candidatus Woesearchaeota archaeon]
MKKLKEKKKQILESIEKDLKPQKVEWSKDVVKRLKEFSANGKMIRGSLFLRTYEILGGTQKVNSIAAALELTQSGILTHDDVMDKDSYRRGKKTIHEQYSSIVTDKHYGYSMAICFGDIAFFESFKLIPSQLKEIYSNQMIKCAYGQMQDVHFSRSNREITKDQIIEVYKNKTARYTFSLPMMMAAKLTNNNVELFEKLGEKLGIIFQIIDDSIGIFGEKNEIGKTPGQDFKENKKTLHRYYLLNKNPELIKYFGKDLTKDELEEVKNHMKTIANQIDKDIQKYQKEADEIIKNLPCDKTFFEELSKYNLSRLK